MKDGLDKDVTSNFRYARHLRTKFMAKTPPVCKTRHSPLFKMRDMARAFAAAKLAGVNARIDILKDGTMSVIPVGEPGPMSDADEIIARLP